MNYLYLCSSPRHIYIALGLALSEPSVKHHLLIINQKKCNNTFAESIKGTPYPFESVDVAPLITHRRKFLAKKDALRKIEAWLQVNSVSKILCGNDRSVEFQYAMHISAKMGRDTVGVYIDDGIGSYIDGNYIRWRRAIVDLTVDRLLKFIFYGSWYHKTRYLGGSKWVQECRLNFPQLAPEYLRLNKRIIPLGSAIFKSREFIDVLLAHMPSNFPINSEVENNIQLFLVLPLSKTLGQFYDSINQYLTLIKQFSAGYERVAVKYHPRETNFYFRSERDFIAFPPSLPAEVVFSLINVDCVVGDTSSALLSARWLNPNAKVICLCPLALQDNPIMKIIKLTNIQMHFC